MTRYSEPKHLSMQRIEKWEEFIGMPDYENPGGQWRTLPTRLLV